MDQPVWKEAIGVEEEEEGEPLAYTLQCCLSSLPPFFFLILPRKQCLHMCPGCADACSRARESTNKFERFASKNQRTI